MREDAFVHDLEAADEDEAERKEMADVREMRARRDTAQGIRRGMSGDKGKIIFTVWECGHFIGPFSRILANIPLSLCSQALP